MKKTEHWGLRRAWFLFEPGCLILRWENSLFPETLHLFPSHQEISEANQTLSAASLLVIMLPLPIQRSLPRRHFLIMVVSGISIFGNSSNEFRSFFCQLFSSSQRCFPIIAVEGKKIFIVYWYHGHTDIKFAVFEPKNYAKNAYFATFANLRQTCIYGLNY